MTRTFSRSVIRSAFNPVVFIIRERTAGIKSYRTATNRLNKTERLWITSESIHPTLGTEKSFFRIGLNKTDKRRQALSDKFTIIITIPRLPRRSFLFQQRIEN